ncbi:hypothetical protein [uncultured Mucilaginibacter sp.]|uniref:hypothetical protein n=1 Tax=uncultured Mucilaginibacter sp. TaxID=797541 RepID=UPI0025DD09F6|nr:hypothetical protein [uncultured Mucilaginibacter sp.]
MAFAHKLRKPVLQSFVAIVRKAHASDKICYALPTREATIVFSAFGRSLFTDWVRT